MWCSSNHLRTPMWARPSAPPPSSATPIRGRGRGAAFAPAERETRSGKTYNNARARGMVASSVRALSDKWMQGTFTSLAQRGDSGKQPCSMITSAGKANYCFDVVAVSAPGMRRFLFFLFQMNRGFDRSFFARHFQQLGIELHE